MQTYLTKCTKAVAFLCTRAKPRRWW